MTSEAASAVRSGVPPVTKRLHVAAPPAIAFDVFTAGMGRWWNPSHRLGEAALRDVVIEPRVGGRWFELDEDGAEHDWGRVLAWERPERLLLDWQLNADWAFDPELHTTIEVLFAPGDHGGTDVVFEHRDLEALGARALEVRAELGSASGWSGLLDAYAERAAAGG